MAKYSTPSGQTGESRNTGKRSYTTTPTPPGHNVTMNAGRHATGESLANVGAQRGGQAEPASNKGGGITGVPASAPIRSMVPRPSIQANQAETSKDLEARIRAKPQPFTYDTTTPNMPTGRHDGSTEGIHYNVMAPVNAKPQSYGKSVGCGNTSEVNYDAVGYSKAQIMAARGYREQHGVAGRPPGTKQAGMPGTKNSSTSSRENSRMRQG